MNNSGKVFRKAGQPLAEEKPKHSKRAERTRKLLQQALTELMAEKGYEAIDIQDITDRAQVGRTTFYLYFKSKDDLVMSTHIESVTQLGWQISIDSLLAPEPPQYLVRFIASVAEGRAQYMDIGRSGDGPIFFRRMRHYAAQAIEQCLRDNFGEQSSKIPFTLLANYLAGAQISLITWWLDSHFPVSPEQLAASFQRLQRATILDAVGDQRGNQPNGGSSDCESSSR